MTGLYFVGVGLLLALAFFVQARWPMATAAATETGASAPVVGSSGRANQGLWLCFIGLALVCFGLQVFLTWQSFIDDSYISFRYSQNLIAGHGLRWNPQDSPTEGYTNLLFVIAIAPFIGLGIDPMMAARGLSLLALAGIVFIFYRTLRRDYALPKIPAIAIALGFIVATRSAEILTSGLETLIYTFAFFFTFERTFALYRSPTRNNAIVVGVLSFASFLIRPEGIFVPIAVLGVIVLMGDWRNPSMRKAAAFLLASFGIPLALYLGWKQIYFGSIVPNPALIKAAGHALTSKRGLQSIEAFFSGHMALLLAVVVALFPLRGKAPGRPELTAILLVVGYLLFFARVDTLADAAERYFYPTSVLLYFLALPVFVFALRFIETWRTPGLLKLALGLFLLGALFVRIPNGFAGYARLWTAGAQQIADDRNMILARRLAAIDGIADMSIACVDAGAIPYATRSYNIDMVGLNTRYIAEHPQADLAANYMFDRKPTIIIYRTFKDGAYVVTGHGPLGDERVWASHPGWDDYVYAGTFDEPGLYAMSLFVRRDAPRSGELVRDMKERVADRVWTDLPVKLGRLAAN